MKVGRPQSYGKIERAARHVREVVAPGLAAEARLPGLKLFEGLAEHSVGFGGREIRLSYHVQILPDGTEALARYDSDQDHLLVTLSEGTYDELERDTSRARFSLCHEIGHAVLHAEELVKLSRMPHFEAILARQQAAEYPIYLDSEWQANAFAAALLMPAVGLLEYEKRRLLSSWIVSSHFGASQECARYRLETYANKKDDLLRI